MMDSVVLERIDVGDIYSNAKGTGARYNASKPDVSLIPLGLLADFYEENTHDIKATMVLKLLGEFQTRKSLSAQESKDYLYAIMDGMDFSWQDTSKVFEYGKYKYAAWNWRKGMNWSIPIGCAARHLLAIIDGEETDPESGLPHRGHIGCNIIMLLDYIQNYPEGDDRPEEIV